MALTLGERLAVAVLQGDATAAYALADLLHEEGLRKGDERDAALRELRHDRKAFGHEVYRWPEFVAFAKRLGFMYDHLTVDVVITIPADGCVDIQHHYRGVDHPAGPSEADTTTLHNETWRTHEPLPPDNLID